MPHEFICLQESQRLVFFIEMTFNALKKTYYHFLSYYKAVFALMFAISLPFSIFEQVLFKLAAESGNRISMGVIGLIFSFVEFFLIQMVLAYGIKIPNQSQSTFSAHLKKYTKPLMIETFRAYAKISIGLLLLIIPGIYRYATLSLIPYIVQFNKSYDKGEVDALELSTQLAKKNLLPFSFLTILLFLIYLGIQFLGIQFVLFEDPISWGLYFLFDTTVISFFYFFFYQYYKLLHTSV